MNTGRRSAWLWGAAALLALLLAAWLGNRGREPGAAPAEGPGTAGAPAVRPGATPPAPDARGTAGGSAETGPLDGDPRLTAGLNAPGGDIRRDLSILNEVFLTWLTNFPRTGNPVGENREITAALMGDNPLRFAFVPSGHPAVNAAGELCDRWGTPFRFHQISGTRMEIISAGPDRAFFTADDAVFTPGQGGADEPKI